MNSHFRDCSSFFPGHIAMGLVVPWAKRHAHLYEHTHFFFEHVHFE